MQDGAPIYTSGETRTLLASNGIRVIDWPAQSPDLNPIENVWKWMSQKVYVNNMQYETFDALKNTIFKAWDDLPQVYIVNLFDNMSDRAIEVLDKKGYSAHYLCNFFKLKLYCF